MTITKRTRLIVLIAAALCLVTVICVVLSGGSANSSGGRGTPYPYSYQQAQDGTVRFTVKGEATEGYHWVVASSSRDGVVEIAEPEKDGKNTVFLLTGQSEGTISVVLQHQSEAAPTRADFALALSVQVQSSLQVDILGAQGQSLEPQKEESTATGYRYQLTRDVRGAQQLRFYGPEMWVCNWEALDYDENIVSVTLQGENDGGYTVSVVPLRAGETSLRVRGRPQTSESQPGVTYSCKITVAEDGPLTLGKETFLEENIPLQNEDELLRMKEAETWLGVSFPVPEGARINTFSRTRVIGNAAAAGVQFSMEESAWNLTATPDKSAAELLVELDAQMQPANSAAGKKLMVDGTTVHIYPLNDVAFHAVWDGVGGITWLLDGGDVSEAGLQEMVKLILASQASAKATPELPPK